MRIGHHIYALISLVTLLTWTHTGWGATSGVTREELQVFLRQPGNAVEHPHWRDQYQNRSVHWQGQVYEIYHQGGDNFPVEVLIKVLPSSRLYDTVLLLPPNHPLISQIKKGQTLVFDGVVIHVVDTMLVKEVHVQFQELNAVPEEPEISDDIDRRSLTIKQGVTLYTPK